MTVTAKVGPTVKQIGYLSFKIRPIVNILPDEWIDNGPRPGADWRLHNFSEWISNNIDLQTASTAISYFKQEDNLAALKLLSLKGLPTNVSIVR